MTFTASIPQASDDPSQSQPLILANFQQLNSQYGTAGDHVEWTASSGNGKHKKVTWINQSGSPPTAGLNELVAYGITQSSITMPYYQRDNIATVYPLAPIKAFARVTATGVAGLQTLSNSFNITQVNLVGTTWTFTITNAMLNATNYAIFGFPSQGSVTSFATINSTTFSFNTSGIATSAGNIFNVFAMEP